MLLLAKAQAKLEFADNSTDRDQRSEFQQKCVLILISAHSFSLFKICQGWIWYRTLD
jgi:hypothetical protein